MLQRVFATPGLVQEFEKQNGPLQVARSRRCPAHESGVVPVANQKARSTGDSLDRSRSCAASPWCGEFGGLQAIERVDQCIGILRRVARAAGVESETVWVIVSDHAAPTAPMVLSTRGGIGQHRVGFEDGIGQLAIGSELHERFLCRDCQRPQRQRGSGNRFRPFTRLKEEGRWGIDKVLDRVALEQMKAFPNAFMAVSMASGYAAGKNVAGPWLTELKKPGGTHGQAPGPEALESVFVAFGPRWPMPNCLAGICRM